MSKVFYNSKINDTELKITENYIQYGSELMPTSALSFISITRPHINWLVPILLVIAGLFCYNKSTSYHYGFNDERVLAFLFLLIGIIWIIINVIKNRQRILRIYSHSKMHLYIEWKGGDFDSLIDAIYNLLAYINKPISINDSSKYMP